MLRSMCVLVSFALLLPLAACTPNPPTTQLPEPRVTSDGTYDYIMVEPRFTIETVPEYGNTKRYIELLYQSREAVAEALSVTLERHSDYLDYFYMPEKETLWERDFFVMLQFDHLYEKPDERLYSVTYSLKVPRDSIDSEAEHFLSALTKLYGEPDDPMSVGAPYSESMKRWTLDKHIEETAGGSFPPDMTKGAEGTGVFLEFRSSTLDRLRPEDVDDKDAYYISLIYKILPYHRALQLIE